MPARYEWERFWCPRDGSFSLDDGGYLVDPTEAIGRAYNPAVRALRDLADTPCIVLLGEPGTGKSVSVEEESKRPPGNKARAFRPPLVIDLRRYGSEDRLLKDLTGGISEIGKWIAEDDVLHLFLDSLDECLLRISTMATLLLEVLERLPVDRLHLRIACRTGDWPQTLEDGLVRIFGQERVAVYELTPLRRKDVAVAAKANGLDADSLLLEIAERGAQALANRPVTLQFLLRAKQERGSLPSSRRDLYLEGCRLLVAETNQSRLDASGRGRLNTDERLRIAECIAAATIFANRYAVWTGPESVPVKPEDVTFRELRAVPTGSPPVSDDAIDEVLSTGLFSSRGAQRFGWAHQTYAEFLAARWAAAGGLDLEQILALLTNPHDPERRLVPQLHEAAAWIGSMRRDVFRLLVQLDPAALLQGDVATADPAERSSLSQALLEGYANDRIVDTDWSHHASYHKLRHSGLAIQLRPFTVDRNWGLVVRRAAINIAEACRVTELQQELIDIALDRTELFPVRKEAASAVAAVADREHRSKLRRLLEADADEDPDDELRGYALEALWPDHLSAQELLRSLSNPRNPNFYGQYKHFVRTYLPETLSDVDLAVALEWVRAREPQPHAITDILEDLADEILIRVWKGRPAGATLRTLAEIVLSRAEHSVPLVSRDHQSQLAELLSTDVEVRRGLIVAMLESMTDEDMVWALWHGGAALIAGPDVTWLLDWLVRGEGSGRAKCFGAKALARFLFDPRDADHVNAVLEAAGECEPLRDALSPFIDPVELDSPRAKEMRSEYEKRQAMEREWAELERRESAPLVPSPAERVQAALQSFEAGDPKGFWILALQLTLKENSRHYGEEFEPDLTVLPGWQHADPETRARIISAAKSYLRVGNPEPELWLGTNIWHRPAFAGYKALRLATSADPQFVATLSQADWARWAPVIVAYPHAGNQTDQGTHADLLRRAYTAAPAAVLDALRRCMDRENHEHGSVYGLDAYEAFFDERMGAAFLAKAKEPATKAGSFRELLWRAMRHGLPDASDYAQSLLVMPLPTAEAQRERAVIAEALLLCCSPERAWGLVWDLLNENEDFGRSVVSELARSRIGAAWQKLPESALASLYVWISRRYAHSDDPDAEGAHWVGPREEIARFRDGLLTALMERGTFRAVEAIRWITDELPHLEWLKYAVHRAQLSARSRTWEPPSAVDVLALGGVREGRLVRSGHELLDAVIASLRRLEVKLQGETPAAIDLWDGPDSERGYRPKDENALSNYVKRHLEEDLRRRGVIVNREVEIRRGEGSGSGENTDIQVDAVTRDDHTVLPDIVTVIVEAKGCWHREIDMAMETQLVGRYLKDNPCRHGLYLVGWYDCPQWSPTDSRKGPCAKRSQQTLQSGLDAQAERLSQGDLEVRALVINAALR